MLIGGAGSGKSVIVADKLGSLPESYNVANVPFNYYTTSGKLLCFWQTGVYKRSIIILSV